MLSSELRERVLQYVDSLMPMSGLEEWLVPRLPLYLEFPDTADADVAAAIELGMAEVSSGIRTQDELRSYLLDVLREHSAVVAFFPSGRDQQTDSSATASEILQTGYSPDRRPLQIMTL